MPKKIRIMVSLTHPTFCQPAAYSAWYRVHFGSLGLPQEDVNEREEPKITLAHIFNGVTEHDSSTVFLMGKGIVPHEVQAISPIAHIRQHPAILQRCDITSCADSHRQKI